jgi:DNA-binding IclR family transcriptional regulator
MLQTAVGRAWLASADAAERDGVLAELRLRDPAQHAAWAPALAQAMRDHDQLGFCVSPGHWLPDVHAVAVPLAMRPGGERLVLNCGLPARRLAPGELETRIAPRLLTLAHRIEREWQAESATAAAPPKRTTAIARRKTSEDAASAAAQTLAHGLDLLACFQPGEEVLGNATLARRLALSPQTVVRLTYTLTQLGLLRRDPLTAGYRLGAGTVAIAYPMLAGLRLRDLARPAMQALSQRLGGAVSLGLRHPLGMVYVESAWRTDGRLQPPDIGAVMPMLATAMGRAWLSRASATERKAVLNQIRVRDLASVRRFEGVVERAMAQFERHGHCSSRDFRPEVEAVAVPFSRPIDAIHFVMNCGVLAPAPLAARQVLMIGDALAEVVRELEAAIGP